MSQGPTGVARNFQCFASPGDSVCSHMRRLAEYQPSDYTGEQPAYMAVINNAPTGESKLRMGIRSKSRYYGPSLILHEGVGVVIRSITK